MDILSKIKRIWSPSPSTARSMCWSLMPVDMKWAILLHAIKDYQTANEIVYRMKNYLLVCKEFYHLYKTRFRWNAFTAIIPLKFQGILRSDHIICDCWREYLITRNSPVQRYGQHLMHRGINVLSCDRIMIAGSYLVCITGEVFTIYRDRFHQNNIIFSNTVSTFAHTSDAFVDEVGAIETTEGIAIFYKSTTCIKVVFPVKKIELTLPNHKACSLMWNGVYCDFRNAFKTIDYTFVTWNNISNIRKNSLDKINASGIIPEAILSTGTTIHIFKDLLNYAIFAYDSAQDRILWSKKCSDSSKYQKFFVLDHLVVWNNIIFDIFTGKHLCSFANVITAIVRSETGYIVYTEKAN